MVRHKVLTFDNYLYNLICTFKILNKKDVLLFNEEDHGLRLISNSEHNVQSYTTKLKYV